MKQLIHQAKEVLDELFLMIRKAWKDRTPLTWAAVWEAIGMSLAGIAIAGIILVIIIFIVT